MTLLATKQWRLGVLCEMKTSPRGWSYITVSSTMKENGRKRVINPFATQVRKKHLMCLVGLVTIMFFGYSYYFATYLTDLSKSSCSLRVRRLQAKVIKSSISVSNSEGYDVHKYIAQLASGVQPDVLPSNLYDYKYNIANRRKCANGNWGLHNIRLLIIVKSAVPHFDQRNAIRNTWCWEQRFPDVAIRCVFILGQDTSDLQQRVEDEHREYEDIVQGDFVDSYDYATVKTIMGLRWVVEFCPAAKFIFFVEDASYVSTKNVLHFANRPEYYPNYEDDTNYTEVRSKVTRSAFKFDFNNDQALLFAGYVYNDTTLVNEIKQYKLPMPCTVCPSLSGYQHNEYPPYVSTGAFLLSFPALRKIYWTSMFTPHFPYDGIFLGMVARRAGIGLTHNSNFAFRNNFTDYKHLITLDSFKNSSELISTWEEQHSLDYA